MNLKVKLREIRKIWIDLSTDVTFFKTNKDSSKNS